MSRLILLLALLLAPASATVIKNYWLTDLGNTAFTKVMRSAGGYLWVVNFASPAKLYKIDPLTGAISDSVTFSAGHNGGTGIAYANSKIYVLFNMATKLLVTEVDPANLATYSDVIDTATYVSASSMVTDGTYMYITIRNASPDKVVRWRISDWTDQGSLNLTYTNAYWGEIDGTNLFLTGASVPGWVARVNLSTWAVSQEVQFTAGQDTATDDIAFAGDYVWIGLEATYSNNVMKLLKTDLTDRTALTVANQGTGVGVWGIGYDGNYILANFSISPGRFARINPATSAVTIFSAIPGQNASEVVMRVGDYLYFLWGEGATGSNIKVSAHVLATVYNGVGIRSKKRKHRR